MNIQLIGISHKTAPVQIRALFAFTDENKKTDDAYSVRRRKFGNVYCSQPATGHELYTVSEENHFCAQRDDCNAADHA